MSSSGSVSSRRPLAHWMNSSDSCSGQGQPDSELAADGFGQAFISREQLAFKLLGERNVCSIVGREVRPELKYPTEQPLMSVANERQIQIVLEGIRRTRGGQPSGEQAPPKGRRDFDIAERRGMEVRFVRLEDGFDFARPICLQEVLDKCRGVDDDDPQEAFRAARSRLISSAAGAPRSTRERRAIRLKTSWGCGRPTSRSRIRSTYWVKVSPAARARLVSSRWSPSGTFRTWIILDMRLASHM